VFILDGYLIMEEKHKSQEIIRQLSITNHVDLMTYPSQEERNDGNHPTTNIHKMKRMKT